MRKSLYKYCIERDEFLLLHQWDKEKNGTLTVHDVSFGSNKKVWWRCEFGHQWEAAVYTRAGGGSGCPYCAGKKVLPSSRTLATEYPELVKQWHPTKNINLSPNDFLPGSKTKAWWLCKNGHEWKAMIKSRTQGGGCPFCSNRRIIVGENDLGTTHPEIAAEWNYEKNGAITPQKVVAGNSVKVWWRCKQGHEYQAIIYSRTTNHNGCPFCSGRQVAPGENDLASAYPQIAAQWHPTKNGVLTPNKVTVFSNRRAWWMCDKGHEFQTTIAVRVGKGSSCPYCMNRKVLVGFNDLATVQPELAAQWHHELNGTTTPQMVTFGSARMAWWECGAGHVWKARINSRASGTKTGCPVCAGKVKLARKEW